MPAIVPEAYPPSPLVTSHSRLRNHAGSFEEFHGRINCLPVISLARVLLASILRNVLALATRLCVPFHLDARRRVRHSARPHSTTPSSNPTRMRARVTVRASLRNTIPDRY